MGIMPALQVFRQLADIRKWRHDHGAEDEARARSAPEVELRPFPHERWKPEEKQPQARIWDWDGISWTQVPAHSPEDRCIAQTRGIADGRLVERCSCGRIRVDRRKWLAL